MPVPVLILILDGVLEVEELVVRELVFEPLVDTFAGLRRIAVIDVRRLVLPVALLYGPFPVERRDSGLYRFLFPVVLAVPVGRDSLFTSNRTNRTESDAASFYHYRTMSWLASV